MLGRGLLACPDLARQIKAHIKGEDYTPLTWSQICNMLYDYYQLTTPLYCERNCGNRVKQWLMYLSREYPQATLFFEAIKRKTTPQEIDACFADALQACN